MGSSLGPAQHQARRFTHNPENTRWTKESDAPSDPSHHAHKKDTRASTPSSSSSMPDHRFLPASWGETALRTHSRAGPEREPPYLVVGLDVAHQDGQVLNAKVHVVVDVLVDALIGRPGVSRGRTTRMDIAPPSLCRPRPVPPAAEQLVFSQLRLRCGCDQSSSLDLGGVTPPSPPPTQAPSPPQALDQCYSSLRCSHTQPRGTTDPKSHTA